MLATSFSILMCLDVVLNTIWWRVTWDMMALVPTEISSPVSVTSSLSCCDGFLWWELPSDGVAMLSGGDGWDSKAWILSLRASEGGIGGIGVPLACVELSLSAVIVCLAITNWLHQRAIWIRKMEQNLLSLMEVSICPSEIGTEKLSRTITQQNEFCR